MEVLVEIAVTHFVDETKLQKIKERGIHTIEIDVSEAHENMDFAFLERLLFDVPSQAKWLYHPEVEWYENEYVEKQKKAWEENQRVKEWLRKNEDLENITVDRFKAYRRLATEEKIRRNLVNAEISDETFKTLTTFILGEHLYVGGRYAWQSAVLAYIVRQVKEQRAKRESDFPHFKSNEMAHWLAKLFDIIAQVIDVEQIVLLEYLKHLETLGLLKQQNGEFKILMLPKEFEV